MAQRAPQAAAPAAAAVAAEGSSEPAGTSTTTDDLLLPLDVVDTAAAYVLYADVPGIESAAQLSIQLKQQPAEQQHRVTADTTTDDSLLPAAADAAAATSQQQWVQRVLIITGSGKVPGIEGPSTAAAPAAAAAGGAGSSADVNGPRDSDAVVFSQRERSFNRFLRNWVLPDDARSEGITAQVEYGVLSIRVPKVASSSGSSDMDSDSDVYGDG
jgi:HSP20 family molecular chaperone IbpA